MLIAFFVFLVGASLGSFLAVWAQRGGFKKALLGRSNCDNCTLEIKGHCLIPIVSWFGLRGKCKKCRISIPFTYVLFEAGLGFALVLLWHHHFGLGLEVLEAGSGAWLVFLRDLFFTLTFALLFIYDYFWKLLPDKITIPAIAIAFAWNLAIGYNWFDLVVGAAIVGGFFFLQYAISRGRWIGGGDVRFGLLLGVMFGIYDGVLSLFVAYILGASIAIVMLLSGTADRKTIIPFGTFLAVSGFIVMLWGGRLLDLVL